MFDIGWSEMALIMAVALVVIGPKDLPRLAREIGKWTGKARAMAREFQRSLDDMAREAELQDIKAEIDKASRTDLRSEIERAVDPDGELRRGLEPPRHLDDFEPAGGNRIEPPRPPAAAAAPDERAKAAAANAGEPPAIPAGAPAPALPAPAAAAAAAPEPATTTSDRS
jgi:sec-independent protein translocase protein TatB